MPKSGKSSLGRKLGHQLQTPFYDTDNLVEGSYKAKTGLLKTCREIYTAHGEAYFRALEEEAIETLINSRTTNAVISLGGGTLLSPTIQKTIKALGTLVYLKAPEKLLWQRVSEKEIPAPFQGENPEAIFLEQMKTREVIFSQLSDHTIEIEKTPKKRFWTI
jgi:Shikimate kinase